MSSSKKLANYIPVKHSQWLRYLIRYLILVAIIVSPITISIESGGNLGVYTTAAQQNSPTEIYLPMIADSFAPIGESLGEDWPMVAANPQRTSWSSEEVSGQLNVLWYRAIEAYIPQNVQLIAANNLIYVSTGNGLLALRASNGDLAWRMNTEMPLGNSPTIDGDVLYVGGYDRKLYALNAYTGAVLWVYSGAGGGYGTNPLVVNGLVILGNRDGKLYAIGAHGTQNQGTLVWSVQTGGPINFSAAYKDGVVYFASNDNHAYAVRVSDHAVIWKSEKLPGEGFNSYWPVIYGDRVIFATASGYRNGGDPGTATLKDAEGNSYGGIYDVERDELFPGLPDGAYIGTITNAEEWSNGKRVIDVSRITEYLEKNPNPAANSHKPWRRALVMLNRSDGSEYIFDSDGDGYSETLPVGMWGTRSGNRYPPIVGPTGQLYMGNTYQKLYIPQGIVMGWTPSVPDKMALIGGQGAVDEPQAISGGGSIIYRNLCCDRVGDYFNISQPGASGRLWDYSDTLVERAPNYDQMWFGTNLDDSVRLRGNYGTNNGIYHNHGDQNAIIPYQGRLFVHRSNAIVAFGQGTGPGELPLVPIQEGNSQPVTPSNSQLQQLLESQVQKIIQAGNLRPGYYNQGQFPYPDLADYFSNPGDTLQVLSEAYWYLSASTQQQLREYLQNYFNRYFDPTMIATIGWSDGATREAMQLPPDLESAIQSSVNSIRTTTGWSWDYPQVNYYGMWKYAQIFPDQAQRVYDLAKSKLQVPVPAPPGGVSESDWFLQRPYEHNGYIAGYLGFLGLQEIAGRATQDSQLRSQVTNELNRLMALRANLFSIDPYWDFDTRYHKRVLNIARNFILLSPELAEYLRNNASNKVIDAIMEYEYSGPMWFVARNNAVATEGVTQNLYDTNALFRAKAYILRESRAELFKYLDVPAFERGDLLYIHNVILLLQAE